MKKKLLFILITLPPEIKNADSEFLKCKENNKVIDYIFKTEELIRPYYSSQEEEK